MGQTGRRMRSGVALLLALALTVGMVSSMSLTGNAVNTDTTQTNTAAPVQTEHPYLYLNKTELADLKTHLNEISNSPYGFSWKSQYDDLVRMAEDYLAETEVQQGFNSGTYVTFRLQPVLLDPNHPYYNKLYVDASTIDGKLIEDPHLGFGCLFPDTLRVRMETLSLAYVLTGDTRYSDRAISYAVQMCGWYFWGDREWLDEYAHGIASDASNAWATQGVATVYDLCYDQLTSEQKEIIINGIIEKGLQPMSVSVKLSTDNGNMMRVGGMLTGIAAIYNDTDSERLQKYIDKALQCVKDAFDEYTYSGKTEGLEYTSFGLEYFLPGLMHFCRATGRQELAEHPLLAEMLPYWTVMFAAPQAMDHPSYSDGGISVQMKRPMAVIAKLIKDPLATYFLAKTKGLDSPFENLVYLDPAPTVVIPSDYVAVVDPIGYGALRTGFAEKDMLLTMLSNSSAMGHNHYEQNAIQFNVGGNWVISDPGAGSYYAEDRSFWTSDGHSTILVNGKGQTVKGTGSMQKVFDSSLYGYIIGSAPGAYGDVLNKFDRHAIQVNHKEKAYYILLDDLDSTQGCQYSWQMYNGERMGFYVDGELVPEMTTAKGNNISMNLGGNKVNLSFVDDARLSIANKVYEANDTIAGYTLTVSSPATKAYQFMTVLSTEEVYGRTYYNFAGTLGGESSAKEYHKDGQISWKSSYKQAKSIVKSNIVGTLSTVFFRGGGAGDYIKMPFTVEKDGIYDAKLLLGVSDGCCKVQASIDGIGSFVVDCSGLPETSKSIELNNLQLSAGEHYVTIEVVGPGQAKDYAKGWYLINVGGLILDEVNASAEGQSQSVTVTETYDTKSVLGARICYSQNLHDIVIFNRTNKTVAAGELSSDGQQASVLGLSEGKITDGFAATKATTLQYGSKVLFKANGKIDIVADQYGWTIDSTKAQNISLAVSETGSCTVYVNGKTMSVNVAKGMVSIPIEKGENYICLGDKPLKPSENLPTQLPIDPIETAPTPTEPSQGEVTPTDPSLGEPSHAGTEETGTAGWVVWLVVGNVVAAAGGAAAWWFIRKRRQSGNEKNKN